MGLFSPAWQDKDTKKALAAVASLDSDGALIRVAKGAHDEAVALFATSRIKDELLLERLALGEPRISVRVAGMALQRIADYRQEFVTILQRLEFETSEGDAIRVTALLSAAMDWADNPAVFAKLLKALPPVARNTYLKRCDRDDDFLSQVLLQCVGVFSYSAPEVSALLWRFSDQTILKTLEMLDDMAVTLSDAAAPLVQGLRTLDTILKAVSTAKAVRARRMALERIADQPTLFKIALNNGSSAIRQEAAGRLKAQADIIEFITANPDDVTEKLLNKALRSVPVEKKRGGKKQKPANTTAIALSQEQLLEVAIKSWDNKARQKAASLITDASNLNLYARHHMSELDEQTVLRMTSQPLLAELACDKYRYRQPVRMAAVSRLTVDERLGQVVWEHTKQTPTEDGKELVAAALPKIRNQDIIYQAMGLAGGLNTRISANALNYITNTTILLKIALGGSRFAQAATERITDAAVLERIIEQTNPKSEVYTAAIHKLEDIRIAALEALNESAIKGSAAKDPSVRVRIAALKRIDDQDFLETLLLDNDPDICAAAVGRLTRWTPLLALVREWRISLQTVLERLSSDVFFTEREAIVAAAAPEVRIGDADKAPRFAAVIAKLTGKEMNDVYLEYGGMEYVQQQIDKALNCRELRSFREARDFLRYAYGKSRECQDALKKMGRQTLLKHYDFNPGCFSERCDVTVETIIDFESEMNT